MASVPDSAICRACFAVDANRHSAIGSSGAVCCSAEETGAGIVRTTYRAVNSALAPFGLVLTKTSSIFDSRLNDPQQLERMFAALAAPWHDWLENQTLYAADQTIDVTSSISEFYAAYVASPCRTAAGGSGFNNLLSLFLVARTFRPTLIIDSGTFTGWSAWALRMGAPGVRILSFDIDMSRLQARLPDVDYVEQDWAEFSLENVDVTRALVYFDDHVDQAKRLIEAHQRGIPLALFDDDYSVFQFPEMAHGGFSLPKVEFVTDPGLREVAAIEFIERGKNVRWPVDVAYLDRAAATIRQADRLPDTSGIAGYTQLPYRIVALDI